MSLSVYRYNDLDYSQPLGRPQKIEVICADQSTYSYRNILFFKLFLFSAWAILFRSLLVFT